MSVLRNIGEAIGAADKLRQLLNDTITLAVVVFVANAYLGIGDRLKVIEDSYPPHSLVHVYTDGKWEGTYQMGTGSEAEIHINGLENLSLAVVSDPAILNTLTIDAAATMETDEGD